MGGFWGRHRTPKTVTHCNSLSGLSPDVALCILGKCFAYVPPAITPWAGLSCYLLPAMESPGHR